MFGDHYIEHENGETIQLHEYNEFNGFSTILNAGYHYTFVYHNFWYLNAQASTGLGIDFYKTSFQSDIGSSTKNNNEVFLSLNTGAAAGYNGRKYYFGIEYNYTVNSEKFKTDDILLQPIRNSFHIFIGYRFKAPRQVSNPIDKIEEKVPILKDKN